MRLSSSICRCSIISTEILTSTLVRDDFNCKKTVNIQILNLCIFHFLKKRDVCLETSWRYSVKWTLLPYTKNLVLSFPLGYSVFLSRSKSMHWPCCIISRKSTQVLKRWYLLSKSQNWQHSSEEDSEVACWKCF